MTIDLREFRILENVRALHVWVLAASLVTIVLHFLEKQSVVLEETSSVQGPTALFSAGTHTGQNGVSAAGEMVCIPSFHPTQLALHHCVSGTSNQLMALQGHLHWIPTPGISL
jgi:hypothetical protein